MVEQGETQTCINITSDCSGAARIRQERSLLGLIHKILRYFIEATIHLRILEMAFNRSISGKTVQAVAIVLAATIAPAQCFAATLAAGIEYEAIPTPVMPPNDQPGIGMQYMKALPGSRLSYLRITAVDGQIDLASLWQPINQPAADTTIIISVHGGGNDFTQNPVRALGQYLSPKGYAVLGINTRQSGSKLEGTDNFYDIAIDIDAAVRTAKALGYKTIVIHGQSLGTVHVPYYAATHWDPDIKGVILTSAMASQPWNSFVRSGNGDFAQVRKTALEALRAGKADERMPKTGKGAAVSARHYLTYGDYSSGAADSTFWIHRIPVPILLIRSEADNIPAYNADWLVSSARSEGSLVPEISFQIVKDPQPPSASGHIFEHTTDQYIDIVSKWLAEQHL